MKLDYNPNNGAFVLRVPANPEVTKALMEEHGLDRSEVNSTAGEDVLFTHEPYAAVAFWDYATERAQGQLLRLQTEIDASRAKTSEAHIKVPLDQELSPFQKAGVEYALRRQNTLIGDVPGLGKTMQAIAFANEIGAKRVLVICPANIRLQWARKIREWTTMPWPYTIHVTTNGKNGVHPHAAWNIISYDLARSPALGWALAQGWYDLLILDEGHYLKTIDAARTRAVFGGGEGRTFEAIASRCDAVLALTGTPLPNRPREAYTLLRGLNFDAIDWMSEDSFRTRFNPAKMIEFEAPSGETKRYIDERTGRHGELQARLRVNIMVRREKHGPDGVLPQLKLPKFEIVQIEPDGAVKRALQAESMLDIDPEHLEGKDAETLGQIATVRRMMGVAMAPLVADYVAMLIDGGEEKLVLFGWHTEVLDIWQKELNRYGAVRIDGSVSASKKQKLVDQFRQDVGTRLCYGNLQSMGTGTDGLQEVCQHSVFGEADWTPGNNQQAVDRLDRMGQDGQVQADFLVAPGSFSERILASSLRKLITTNKALDRRM